MDKIVKTKSVNCYTDGKRRYAVVELEDGTKTFVNLGLLQYAADHIKEVKEKASK